MSNYRGTADRPDQAKAIAAVVAVHIAIGFIILSGLKGDAIRSVVESLTTIDIRQPPPQPPPVPPPPKPTPKPQATKQPEGAGAKKSEPTPVVAPQPKLPVQSPIPAAKIAGTGASANSGAGVSGNGTGAGGAGDGPGGGDNDAGFTPARRISKIPDREYRALAATGLRSGSVGVTIRVNPDGNVSNCRIARSSGDGSVDALMCDLT
ncbi:MAG: TonB family protein, partial [Sphingomonas sp.]|nr:TonB family protein [Sphingomonas sp.]